MYKINIKISSSRDVEMTSYAGGVTGENNAACLVFDIPSEYSSFNKYLDVFKESGEKTQTVLSVNDESEFSYVLPGKLADNLNTYMQLVLKKGSTVFKSYRFTLTFEEGINATGYIESEYRDSIETLYEIKADRSEVEGLEKELSDKVAVQVFYKEKMFLENMIAEKADKEAVEKALLEKADAAEVESRLGEKADKTEVSEALEAKADKTYVGSEISQKASTADVEAALELKADKAGLEAKADKSEIPAKISELEDDTEATPVQYANKAYCDEYGANIAKNYQLKSYIVDKISVIENLDSEHYPSVVCLTDEITRIYNSMMNYATKTELSEVEAVAKGRATGYVFDTLEELDSWLENPNNTAGLVLGDNLYIRATDVPDYWWDGSARQQLETQKVDLSEYATKEEVGEIEAALDKIIAIQNTLIGGEAV